MDRDRSATATTTRAAATTTRDGRRRVALPVAGRDRAEARLEAVPAMCGLQGLDLTVGCTHACGYCEFERYQSLTTQRAHAGRELDAALSLEAFLLREEYPPEVYLSPMTDPLAPAARAGFARVLDRLLPRGLRVIVSTKGVASRRHFAQMAPHAERVRFIVGVTSLDDARNAAVEPGCPPARARLGNLRLAREAGLSRVTARLDPILPGVDDDRDALSRLLDRVAEGGAHAVTASYLFIAAAGPSLRVRRAPYLGAAAEECTDLCPVESGVGAMPGGTIREVRSVPLARKQDTYAWLREACAARGMAFGTCGCKDLRLTDDRFPTACTFPDRTVCSPGGLVRRATPGANA